MNVTMNSKLRFQLSLSVVGLAFMMLQCVAVESGRSSSHRGPDNDVPYFDWRPAGVISKVKDMGNRSESSLYVVTECVESYHATVTNKLYTLSVNELEDCCHNNGGSGRPWHKTAMGFECVLKLGGMCTDQSYGSASGSCHNGSCPIVAKVPGVVQVPPKSEDKMADAIQITPLMVYIDASQPSFQTYTSGIYDDKDCSQTTGNHALQLVGFGYIKGQAYWIGRNSWGTKWGDEGYIYLSRGNNTCGLANSVIYPH